MKIQIQRDVDIIVYVSARRNDAVATDKFEFILRGDDLFLRTFPQDIVNLIELESLALAGVGSTTALLEKTISQTLRDVRFKTIPGKSRQGDSWNRDGLMTGNLFQMYFYGEEGENAIYTGKIMSVNTVLYV